jgi:glycine/D-amino acid oxidase-like deaminating enzyme
VIGSGVIGLVNSWVLLDAGYHVTILAHEYASFNLGKQRLTSQIAGALWEYPPAVCGAHTDLVSLQSSKRWCMESYHVYFALASFSKATGVRILPSAAFFPYDVEKDPSQLRKMMEIQATSIRGFRRSASIISEHRIEPMYGAVDAYEILVPVIDTDAAMAWLTALVREKGATMITEPITGDLLDQEASLLRRFNASAIINASGSGAKDLAGDKSCYPLRGALLRVRNDGTDFPKLNTALSIAADVNEDHEIVFLVPRGDDVLLMGGIAEPGEGELNLTLESPVIKQMRERCEKFLPCLKDAKLVQDYPLAQGLRPFRKGNVRVEREWRGDVSRIVHSYGHGGSGWSLAFGCALDVRELVKEILDEKDVARPYEWEVHGD